MSFLDQIKQRRTIYVIGNNVALAQDKIEEIINDHNVPILEED